MALALNDRVQQTGTANTTVSFTLSGSVTGYQSFAVIGDTNTTYYSATDSSGNWEVGIGTYSTTGPTLTRTTILSSSNSGSAVTFSGTVSVFVTYPANKSVNQNASGNVVLGTNTTYIQVLNDTSYPGVYAAGGTNTPLVLQPLGTGALQAQKTDSTATGGNARGANAVDWQTSRAQNYQVSSGSYAVIAGGLSNQNNSFGGALLGGNGNYVNGAYSAMGGGQYNQTVGYFGFVGSGQSNYANGYYNFIGGGFTNNGTSSSSVTTQSGTMNGTTAVTLSGSNASIKVGQYITGTSIAGDTYVAAIS